MEDKKYIYTGNFSDEEKNENGFEEDSDSFELDVGILRESGRNNTIYITKSDRSVGWRFIGTKLDITPYIQHLIDKGLVIEEIDLYDNENIIGGMLQTTYLCVHDDIFGREIERNDIMPFLNSEFNKEPKERVTYNYLVKSMNKNKVNVFILNVITPFNKPYYLEKCEENNYEEPKIGIVSQLENRYYTVIPCRYNSNNRG